MASFLFWMVLVIMVLGHVIACNRQWAWWPWSWPFGIILELVIIGIKYFPHPLAGF